jgi:sporulation protein YlmC with PRC-barrel domain
MAKQMMVKLVGSRVYVHGKQTKKQRKNDQPADPKKIGKVHNLVFSADSRVVVGVMLKRPDIAGMVKRDDRFIPLDALKFVDAGVICRGEKGDFDKDACKRLSLDLDHCIIWGGADVYCESGKFLGYVMDARVDVETGEVDCFCVQEGSAASSLVGTFDIPAAWVIRYDRGRMIVKDQAAKIELSGGLAGKAGEGYAAAKEGAKQAASKAGAAASAAVDKGSHGLGKVIGKAKVGVQRAVEDFQEASGADAASRAGKAAANTAVGDASAAAGNGVAQAKAASDNGQKAARAVGEQLGKTKGMFSGFLREFKDASK